MDTNKNDEKKEVPIEEVQFKREWTFWENYEPKAGKDNIDYTQYLSDIFTFNTIIDFWQFWNAYPGAEPQNIFFNGERMR